ncbi:MAG TPA: acyl-CoA dehydrogenase domain-containing protein, partial [Caulobacter sp.]|nr:acyl-CoA dehydrogenase domain-containing protein [Caulobacter sp.]
PFGARRRGPSDQVIRACADLLLHPSPTRDRLVEGVYVGGKDEAIGQLIDAFERVVATQPIHDRLKDHGIREWKDGLDKGLLTPEETSALAAADAAVAKVIAVDDFAPEELSPALAKAVRPPSQVKRSRASAIAEPTVGHEPRAFGDETPPLG